MCKIYFTCALLIACTLLASTPVIARPASEAQQIEVILERANNWLWLGMSNQGNRRAFDESFALVDHARHALTRAKLSAEDHRKLSLQVDALRQDLEILEELYGERFYGVFPLVRLVIPSAQDDEGLNITEQLYHAPDIAAVEIAVKSLSGKIASEPPPRILIKSSPENRKLENIAHQVLAQEGNSLPENRSALIKRLSPDDLQAFDENRIDSRLIARMMRAFNTESLILMTLKRASPEGSNLVKYVIGGDLYLRGEAIQGSVLHASGVVRVNKFTSIGYIIDRREMFWPIVITRILLLLTALVWAANINWNQEKPLQRFGRLVVGATLFIFGVVFTNVCVQLLQRAAPAPNELLAATWWWPALLGLIATLGSGLVAWLAQAQLAQLLPKMRNARSVGSLFALVALGAAAYFVQPILLLEGFHGFTIIIPLVLTNISLAVLFAFALRTGPPVPHYFSLGPLLLASLLGISLMMSDPAAIWLVTGASAMLCVVAMARHRYAVKHGFEEPEPDPLLAAQADQATLAKVAKKIVQKH